MKHTRMLSGIVLLELVTSGCIADEVISSRSEQEIVNGASDSTRRSVVRLVVPTGIPCTGTLITSRTVLTAAHCVNGFGSMTIVGEQATYDPAMNYWYWGTYTITGTPVVAPTADIALVNLPNAVGLGVTMGQIGTYVAPGMQIQLVGYGETSLGAGDWNVRRAATNTIDRLDDRSFYFSGATGTEGGTCRGDSGGPAFRIWSDCIVGTTTGQTGIGPLCDPNTGEFYHTRVDPLRGWIQTNAIGAVQTCTP